MDNVIIMAVVVVVIAVGVYSTVKHFQAESGCCGGGGYRLKKKKLKNIIGEKTFRVEGMHCEHCKNRVEETVNDIRGVAGRVDLKKGKLTVSYAEPVDDALICSRLARLGYTVIEQK